MAKTGRTDIGFTTVPHAGDSRPHVISLPEKAGQEFMVGALLQNSAGYIIEAADGDPVSTGLGFSREIGQDLAADGDALCALVRFEAGREFEATLNGVAGVNDTTEKAKVVVASGVPTLTVDAGGKVRITRLAPGWNVGDTNARVYAIPMDSFVEQGGGNE